jgi:hypothetical protein
LPRSVQILAFAALALMAWLAWLAFQRETTIEPSASPLRVADSERLPPSIFASPVTVSFPDTLILITHTPEATPEPTPTYAMLPTPRPPAVCMTSTPRGIPCTQPERPLPPPTPMLPCPVAPGEECLARGGPVQWLTPTPTFVAEN